MILNHWPVFTAYPESCNILDNVSGDVRTPDKLLDGDNDTYEGQHMWLAPILPQQVGTGYVFTYKFTIIQSLDRKMKVLAANKQCSILGVLLIKNSAKVIIERTM